MWPVICFYENNKFIHSLDYKLLSCADDQDALNFLGQIEKDFSNNMKVVKINFAALEKPIPNDPRKTYIKTPKAQVFVLNNFDIVSEKELDELYPGTNTAVPVYYTLMRESVFKENVSSIIQEICQGRFYQMNYTAALQAETPERYSMLHGYLQMTKTIGCDYRAFLPLAAEETIVSLSPELFLHKKGSLLKTQPIKGTLRRGLPLNELLNNEKENAELSMIVDLLRNDLNTLSCEKYNDVSQVNFHRKIMDLKYTSHTYSEVSINTSKKFSEIIATTFPGGSISGCPKKESLKKIAEIENYHRDFYTGSIGWWQKDDFCLNIAIRSTYHKKRELFYFTGCGIVFDSDPAKEWEEFLTKCSFLNMYAPYTPVVDTLEIKASGFTYLQEHIERTYLAFRDQQVQVEQHQIQRVYEKIQKELMHLQTPHKVRLVFTKDLTYNIETTPLEEPAQTVKLQLMPFHFALPRFKTTERSIWNNLLKKKDPAADDVLIVNAQDNIADTSIYSVYYKLGDEFFTPPQSDGGMHSVFQTYHIKKGSITVDDRTYKLSERSLRASEAKSVELYVANSVRGLKKASLLF